MRYARLSVEPCGWQACHQPGFSGIYGFDASAHLTAQIALKQGARVHVLTRSPAARALALELGVSSAAGSVKGTPYATSPRTGSKVRRSWRCDGDATVGGHDGDAALSRRRLLDQRPRLA